MNPTNDIATLEAKAESLRDEAGNIGDQFGNMGPMARKRADRLYAEARALDTEARALRRSVAPQKVGIVCTGCGNDIGNEGVANLDDGYTECCNEPTR